MNKLSQYNSMNEYSTLVGGIQVSNAEQEAIMSTEVQSLERARDHVLDQITALERTLKKKKTTADVLTTKARIQVLKKDARRRYQEIYEKIDFMTILFTAGGESGARV